jgi:hypothetical protein
MHHDIELRKLVEELIGVVQQQSRALERLVAHVEQAVGHLKDASDLSIIRSELAALHVRARQLAGTADQK